MAAETTNTTANSVHLSESITGSLVDAATKGATEKDHQLSTEFKNYETEEDEQTCQDNKSGVSLPEEPDVLCKVQINKEEYKQASSDDSEEVTTEDSKLNETLRHTGSYPVEHIKHTTTFQQDNGDRKERDVYDGQKTVLPEDNGASQEEISLTLNVKDSRSKGLDAEMNPAGQNGDETVVIPKEEALHLASDKGDDAPHQEHHVSKTTTLESYEASIKELEEALECKGCDQAVLDQDEKDIRSQIMLEDEAAESSPKGAIAQNIQQGELLLYRLHIVQQNQELQQVSDGQPASNTAAMVMTTNETIEHVTMMPDPKGEDDGEKEGDLSLREESTERKEREEEQYPTEGKREEGPDQASLAKTTDHKEAKMKKELSDDDQSDSGVSADFFPGGINELPASDSEACIPRPAEETPIQREIRQVLEREKTLRQSRGLHDLHESSQELVDIPMKKFLEAPGHCSGTNFVFDAEKRLAKRKMLQDITQETMKEHALKKLGKVPGSYSLGHVQDLKERKMLFDSFHQCKKMDAHSFRYKKFFSFSFTAGDADKHPVHGDGLPFVSVLERTRSLELFTNCRFKDSDALLCGSESDQAPDTACQVENHKEVQKKPSDEDDTQSDSLGPSISLGPLDCNSETIPSNLDYDKKDEGSSILKSKNPFFQLRPALSLRPDVEKEIREAVMREQELRRMRSRLYGGLGDNLGDKQEVNTQSPSVECSSSGSDHGYRGKLTLIWPPPSSKVEEESGPPKPTGQRPTLQQRWEMVTSSCTEND